MPNADYFDVMRGAFEETERDITCQCGVTVRWLGTQFDAPRCTACQRTPAPIISNLRVILNGQLCAIDRLRDLIDRQDQLRHGRQMDHEVRVAAVLGELKKKAAEIDLEWDARRLDIAAVHDDVAQRMAEVLKRLKAYEYRPRKRKPARRRAAKRQRARR
jgi:hypothetical protein